MDEDISAQHLIDFSPIYRCLHIYSVLGARDVFENYYRTQREKQARLVVQPYFGNVRDFVMFLAQFTQFYCSNSCYNCNLQSPTIQNFQIYLRSVAGFFVQEDHILNTSNGLIDRSYVDNLWSSCVTKIVSIFKIHTVRFSEKYLLYYCEFLDYNVRKKNLFSFQSQNTDANFLLRLKHVILLFSATLKVIM